jgi:hypothetical protein
MRQSRLYHPAVVTNLNVLASIMRIPGQVLLPSCALARTVAPSARGALSTPGHGRSFGESPLEEEVVLTNSEPEATASR